MRRLLKKKINIFGKEISVVLVGLLAVVMVSAALLSYYGQVEQTVIIGGAAAFTGGNCDTDGYCTEDFTINACESATSETYNIESLTGAVIPLGIYTTVNTTEPGITNTIEYLLDPAGSCPGADCERRLFIAGSDVGVNTLSDLDNMTWDVNVVNGYIAHVDIIVDTDEDGIRDDTLVFEYAKVNSTHCDETPYPTGEMDTFDGLGIVNTGAYAWLSSGPPGGCGSPPTVFFWHSLNDWQTGAVVPSEANGKTVNGTTVVIGFEIEVDNWIENSNSEISNIQINGNPVELSLLPSDMLSFDVFTEIDCLTPSSGPFTLTTTVTAR